MMSPIFLSLASVLGVTLLSLIGIVFFLIDERIMKKSLLYFVSFSTGALLGDVFLHMIPEFAEEEGFLVAAMPVVLLGIVFSFCVEKIIHWRHCHLEPEEDTGHHHHVGTMSILGETVHNLIDGIIIAASYMASIPLGISTTIAIVFHEIPHEVGNFAVLLHSGFTKKRALMLNLLSACAGILGTLAVLFASTTTQGIQPYLLPFAAGNLLYIAGSDLIPELHRSTRLSQGVIQLIAMLIGIGSMYLVLFLE